MAGAPVFLAHPSSLDHDLGPHPEQPDRITAIERECSARGWLGFDQVRSPAVERSVLEAVHPGSYVSALEAVAASGGGWLDADTGLSGGSVLAAAHGSGGAVALVGMLMSGQAPTGFSAHRPPGHHATPARAMGFCLFNHVAVAARFAVDQLGCKRVMIVDWDVHHGNGTQDIFFDSDEVLFVSIHQSPLYPGSGAVSEVGAGSGTGYTVNLPVPAGSGDREWVGLVEHVVVGLARAFAPELMLISAGFDAHREDPLAGCQVTEAGFAGMASLLVDVSHELSAPLGAVLEGGYALGALARSVAATMEVMGAGAECRGARADGGGGRELTPLEAGARARLGRWWAL